MIWDCFPFFQELDMLELRIHTLGPVVDTFILAEGNQTFQGQPKPLHYHEHKQRFAPLLAEYGATLVHVPVTMFPMTDSPWEAEYFQRNAILRGLRDARPDDLIIISDVDEIPHPQVVEAVKVSYEHRLLPSDAVVCCEQVLYAYTLNWRHVRPWYGTRMLKRRSLDMPQALRSTITPRPDERVLTDAGWSFSSFGGVEEVRKKLQSFSHAECNTPEYTDRAHIEACIRDGKGILPTDSVSLIYVEIDETYPQYILDNPEKFQCWLADKALAERWAV